MLTQQIKDENRFYLSITEVVIFLSDETGNSPEDIILSILRIEQRIRNYKNNFKISIYKIGELGTYTRSEEGLRDLLGNDLNQLNFGLLKTKSNGISDNFFRSDELNEIEDIKKSDLKPIDSKVIELTKILKDYKLYREATLEKMESLKKLYNENCLLYETEAILLREENNNLRNQLSQSPNETIRQQQQEINNLKNYIDDKLIKSVRAQHEELNRLRNQLKEMLAVAEDNHLETVNKKQAITIKNLENKLSAFQEELRLMQVNSSENELKDSIYHLIFVLKKLLLEISNTGYFFSNKDNPNAKQKPTQEMLVTYISEMGKKGLGRTTINKIFSKANNFEN